MDKKLVLLIKNPTKILVEEHDIVSMRVPMINGSLGIRPGHAFLLGEVEAGKIQYLKEDSDVFEEVNVEQGILQILNDQVNVFCVDMDDDQPTPEQSKLDELNETILNLLYDQFSKDADDAT